MLAFTLRHTLPAAYALLPPAMASPAASAMLLAIALQESKFATRLQRSGGPARGFWQFESAGVKGVLRHKASATPIAQAVTALCYPKPTIAAMQVAIRHNDVLAACFARCLLWTLPYVLPRPMDVAESYDQYLAAWRPGRPHPETWDYNFRLAWNVVLAYGDAARPTETELTNGEAEPD